MSWQSRPRRRAALPLERVRKRPVPLQAPGIRRQRRPRDGAPLDRRQTRSRRQVSRRGRGVERDHERLRARCEGDDLVPGERRGDARDRHEAVFDGRRRGFRAAFLLDCALDLSGDRLGRFPLDDDAEVRVRRGACRIEQARRDRGFRFVVRPCRQRYRKDEQADQQKGKAGPALLENSNWISAAQLGFPFAWGGTSVARTRGSPLTGKPSQTTRPGSPVDDLIRPRGATTDRSSRFFERGWIRCSIK